MRCFIRVPLFKWSVLVPMINPSAVAHCEKEEILHGLVPSSFIKRIFGEASLVLITDHAKESLQCAHLKIKLLFFFFIFCVICLKIKIIWSKKSNQIVYFIHQRVIYSIDEHGLNIWLCTKSSPVNRASRFSTLSFFHQSITLGPLIRINSYLRRYSIMKIDSALCSIARSRFLIWVIPKIFILFCWQWVGKIPYRWFFVRLLL
jgi:hypothetical protein